MHHLTTFVTAGAADGAAKVMNDIHEESTAVIAKDTQGSVGVVYELYLTSQPPLHRDDTGVFMCSVEAYLYGRKDGFELWNDTMEVDENASNIQADLDHHAASPD